MNKKILSILQYLLFLGLSIFLVWWSVRKITDKGWEDIKDAFRNANYLLIVPVMITLLLSHYSRALRWKILMEPLGYKPRVFNIYMAVLIGYMANLAVPRLGEVLKCTILARYEKVPADKLVGTIVAERAFDVLCLVLVILITFFTQADLIGGYLNDTLNTIVQSKTSSLSLSKIMVLVGVLLLGITAVIVVFKKFSHIKFIQKIKTIFEGIWHGITSVRYLKNKGWFVFHTIFIWSMYLLSVQIGFWAMKDTAVYTIPNALSVLTMGSLAMIVPAPGGGIGVYAWFVQNTMLIYGLKETIGFAFGQLMWSVQFFFALLSGFLALSLLPYFNKRTTVNEKS
ncbi:MULTISPECIES: lysylphosphatidylglycerol synthase transmembrane domain-containing protein [Niastella]|uniref:Flippase-like domain-containing protein n=1 Tax=Niastella soli TaxID=2821487 RepID=A0ABS3YYT5_9BACT|nr:lysylphosphatidylglycerol synthase transmembrane domain-containing protein [Niastella soli]MBO9202316.1 flippase-like domain-containing protein [Niastella soli]